MDSATPAQPTPFYRMHVALNAKIAPFAGYLMPIQYSGIIDEHRQVRERVGVFDVSHMGEFIVTGRGAEAFLNRLTINDVANLNVGQVQYSAMCYPDGGIVDDLLIYRFADHYMMVVNASNIDKDFEWARSHCPAEVQLTNCSADFGLLAVQGPLSIDVLQPLTNVDLAQIPFYHFCEGELAGRPMIISRTGYTGEKGFELYHAPQYSEALWEALFKAGATRGIKPIGLGARDTLRLEMKYCLYGNDIDAGTNPLEAGLGWITKLYKADFIGREALLREKEKGSARKLIAFEMTGRALARHGYAIWYKGQKVGHVTSGSLSPTLNKGIGLGYVASNCNATGTELEIEIRGSMAPALIVKPPFVTTHTL